MLKVLVVDDDESVSLFMSRLLAKKFMCKVSTAINGLKALSKIKEEEPDVVFLDITMPVMDGIETLEAIRSDEEIYQLPVIMLTAVKERSIVDKIMELDVLDYMVKPLIYDRTFERLKEIFAEVKRLKREKEFIDSQNETIISDSVNNNLDYLLIIDDDESLRNLLKNSLSDEFNILESSNGADGMKIFMQVQPKVVCMGQNLSLLNERMLAGKINKTKEDTIIFSINDSQSLEEWEREVYDYIIPKNQKTPDYVRSRLKKRLEKTAQKQA
jgi:PleD family two-component response regulator